MSAPVAAATAAPVSSTRRRRELVGVGLWALAAAAWVAAMLVPWFRAGVTASTTPLEVAELLRAGVLGVPPVAGYAVLLLPGIALVLLGIAPLRGGGAMAARVVLWLVGTAAGLLLVVFLSSISAQTFGVGAALVVAGCVLGGAALGLATVRVPASPDGPDAT
ncbi:hypothetical protein [Nocardioides sp.]|uniref:hypothetical protein n=1 Tax=Nocardioides sp. TaxID=35761 RepID=UPI002717FD40|nr:hypothetical protein [Nocardioides sp.]MDO9457231.1 hypothetical protein [Nocardioides sp.]